MIAFTIRGSNFWILPAPKVSPASKGPEAFKELKRGKKVLRRPNRTALLEDLGFAILLGTALSPLQGLA